MNDNKPANQGVSFTVGRVVGFIGVLGGLWFLVEKVW